jgi:hypothetical protein
VANKRDLLLERLPGWALLGHLGRSGLEWLKHSPHTRERWREYREIDVNHTVELSGVYEQVRRLTDEELRQQLEQVEQQQRLPDGD